MSFRFRLVSFFIAALIAMQLLMAVLVYRVTRNELIDEGRRQLDAAAVVFARQLDDIAAQVASSVQVLSHDYALRAAIARRDEATLRSALRNHGRRIGATRMLALDVDGKIEADTLDVLRPGAAFPYPRLMSGALEQPAFAVVAWRQRAYWMIAVPVHAPDLVGYIAAAIPIDDAVLARLQAQSTLPKDVELATPGADGGWTVLARGARHDSLATKLLGGSRTLPSAPSVIEVGGGEYVVRALWLGDNASPRVAAVLGYSVDAALRPYKSVAAAWALLLGLGLIAGLIGTWLIARGVSRPIEQLAASARRISAGDYGAPPAIARSDEIGDLATAFASMAESIHSREAHILHQAGHDQLTGLPNRLAVETVIRKQLEQGATHEHALLMIGLGRLAEIIKTMGHMVSDRLMREAGRRLSAVMGEAVLARATDAEFCLFLPGAGRAEAVATAFRLIETLAEPYQEAELTLDTAPAIGIALAPLHGSDAGVLMRGASVALLSAVDAAEPVAIYDAATDPHRPERLSLMGDLREAIEQNVLRLHLQPKLELASGRIDGAEGLVRWQHPRFGAIAPDHFVRLAEETGNVRRLTRWALATGVAQAARWQEQGNTLRIAINVSARDLDDAHLPRRVADLLTMHRVSADRIVLEITESAIMDKPDAALGVLQALAAQGVALAIDDFGVGHSSLAYLRRLPVRELKIDRTFVRELAHAREDRKIVRSIVALAHDLGYRVTAEGVEDAGALDYLAEIGCDHAQGYLIARPLDAEAFDRFIGSLRAPPVRFRARGAA